MFEKSVPFDKLGAGYGAPGWFGDGRNRIEVEGMCCYGMYPSGSDTEGEAVGEGL
jgi:hypothetical protein